MSLNLQEQINHLQAQLDALRRIHENPTLTNQDGAEFIPVSKNINGEWVDYKIVNTLGKDLDVLVESSDFVVSNVLNKKIVIASGSINITIDTMFFTPIEKGLRVELIQATTTAPTLVVGQGATLLYDSETVPDFNGINSGLRLTYLGDNDWYIEKITNKEGGATTYASLTDASTVDLPTTNTSLAEALAERLLKDGYTGTAQDLKDLIDSTVSGFQGILLGADSPTEDGIYVPSQDGTYTNAGNLIYDPSNLDAGKLVFFLKKGSNWSKLAIDVNSLVISEIDESNELAATNSKAVIDYVQDLFYKNLFDKNFASGSGYLRSSNGTPINQAPVNGNEFAISDFIAVKEDEIYFLTGRSTEIVEGADTRAVVCYDLNDAVLKPCDLDGNPYPNFSIPTLNGAFRTPIGCVKLRFNTKFHSLPTTTDNIQIINSDVELPYTSFEDKGNKAVLITDESPVASLFYKNIYDKTFLSGSGYLRSSNGTPINQAPINGNEFSVSPMIIANEDEVYYISGRSTEVVEGADTRAVVCYDVNDAVLKPCDLDGNPYPTFSIPILNGAFRTPIGCVYFKFNDKFHSLPTAKETIQVVRSSLKLPYTPFGVDRFLPLVVSQEDVPDGHIMIKKGDTYEGLDPNEVASSENKPLNDLGYPIYGSIAGTVANFQTLQFEEVNQVPQTGKHLIFYNGNLVFVNEGVTINLV